MKAVRVMAAVLLGLSAALFFALSIQTVGAALGLIAGLLAHAVLRGRRRQRLVAQLLSMSATIYAGAIWPSLLTLCALLVGPGVVLAAIDLLGRAESRARSWTIDVSGGLAAVALLVEAVFLAIRA